MDLYWSTYVQETRELYYSRALRFYDGNKDLWLKLLQVENGMNVLEVGCGGGIFCHRIKTYLPGATVTGLDFDTGHIEFAKAKTQELGLDCKFINGDATALPFNENTFDLCYSHTVMSFCEPNLFVKEQYRVLKPGGKMVVLVGINYGDKPESWVPTDGCEEKELFDRLWDAARKNSLSDIKRYDNDESNYFEYLRIHGFKNISADALAVTYMPDSANVSDERAIEMINEERLSTLCSSAKARRMAPDCLSPDEYDTMIEMINRRFDNRIAMYNNGVKLWNYRVGTVLAVSGTK